MSTRSIRALAVLVVLPIVLLLLSGLSALPVRSAPNGVITICTDAGLTTALASGGSFTFSCGGSATISISTQKIIAKNVTLDGGGLITLTGNYAVSIFSVLPTTTLALKNIRISEGHSDGAGGAIFSRGKLSIDNVKFINNSAHYDGGAIASLSGTLSINGSVFFNNNATGSLGGGGGGAIANGTNVKANLSNNQFFGNYTQENGGVIANNGLLTSTSDSFASNSATGNGGAAYNSFSGTLTINGGELDLNTAYGSGGAIWNEGGIVQIINLSTLSENSAPNASGGGIENSDGGLLVLKNTILTTNTASYAGGGLDNNFAAVQLTTTRLVANSAGIGGGLHSIGFASIDGSAIMSNSVSDSGGGIYNRGLLTITGWTVFMSNTAVSGGAIRNAGGGWLYLNTSQLNDNFADSGGAISNTGTATVVGTNFILNSSTSLSGHGGAIENAGSYSQTDGYFNVNSAPGGSGGAIYNSSILNITHVYFDFGSAFTYGGAIHNDTGGRATIARSVVYLNSAGWGAGIYNNGILTSVNNTIGENISGTGIHNIGSLVITNSTIIHNGSPDINNAGGTTSLHNTIVGTCANPVINAGHNIQYPGNSCGLTIPNVDPDLGPLADHGGKIYTYNLLPGSPAIDFGDNVGCPPIDARGMRRPADGNHDGIATCDIGAYEEQVYVYLPLINKNS